VGFASVSFGYNVLGFGSHPRAGGSTLTDGLVSWWNLDETSGTRVDSHGSNDLADINTVGNATGKISNAASYVSANNEYLVKAAPTGVNGGDRDFTLAGWIWYDALVTKTAIKLGALNSGAGNLTDWMLYLTSNKLTFYGIATSSFQGITATSFGALSTGTWYHFALWQDAGAPSLNIQMNNGTIDDNTSYTTLTHQTGAVSLQLGGGYGASYIDGRLDEVGFWDRVLTPDERAELYNSGDGIGYPG
jgi:hypothetical protein